MYNYNTDCIFYTEGHDFHATIPHCTLESDPYNCPCKATCSNYLTVTQYKARREAEAKAKEEE